MTTINTSWTGGSGSGGGSGAGITTVATVGDLPAAGGAGLWLTEDTSLLYYWTGLAWVLIAYQIFSEKDQGNGYAGLDGSLKLNSAQLPSLAITDIFNAISEAAMLALAAEQGDMCVRSDVPKTFILATNDPTQLADWIQIEILQPATATQAGIITLSAQTMGDGKKTFQDDVEVTGALTNTELQTDTADIAALKALDLVTGNRSGFPNFTDSVATFSNTGPDRTFQIAPAVTSFDFYEYGVKYTKSGAETIQIDDTEGLHFIYYEGGVLQKTTTFTDALISKALVHAIHWDQTNSKEIGLLEERHGLSQSARTHLYIHSTRGAALESGGGLGDILVDQDGSLDTHAQMSNLATTLWDEDNKFSHAARISTANISVYYRSGADVANIWRLSEAASFPVLPTGTGRAAWNQLTGGNWQQTEVANLRFVLAHVFAYNDVGRKYGVFQGQAEYTTVNNARLGALTEVNLLITQGMPLQELVFLGTIIYQTSTSYSNAVKSRIRSTDTGDDYVDLRDAFVTREGVAGTVTEHNALATIQGGTVTERYHQTAAQNTASTRDATNLVNGLMPSGKLTGWDAAVSHAAGNGGDHGDVATNSSHSSGTGSDHSSVASNTSHRGASTEVHGLSAGVAVVGTTEGQDITLKRFNDAVTYKHVATPANPAAGYSKIYPLANGKIGMLNSAGGETRVDGGLIPVMLTVTGVTVTPSPNLAAGKHYLVDCSLATTSDFVLNYPIGVAEAVIGISVFGMTLQSVPNSFFADVTPNGAETIWINEKIATSVLLGYGASTMISRWDSDKNWIADVSDLFVSRTLAGNWVATHNLAVNGFTTLGDHANAPAIKTKYINVQIAAGATGSVAHDLNTAQIIGMHVALASDGSAGAEMVAPGKTGVLHYGTHWSGTHVYFTDRGSSIDGIVSCKLVIFYEDI